MSMSGMSRKEDMVTEQEHLIHELQWENQKLKKENAELKEIRYLDQAEISYQRRQIDFLMGALDEANSIANSKARNAMVITYGE